MWRMEPCTPHSAKIIFPLLSVPSIFTHSLSSNAEYRLIINCKRNSSDMPFQNDDDDENDVIRNQAHAETDLFLK